MAQFGYQGGTTSSLLDASLLGIGEVAILRAGRSVDTLLGGSGHDRLSGGAGADLMLGGAGDDSFFVTYNPNSAPRDTIDGGVGNDLLVISIGASQLTAAVRAEVGRLALALAMAPGGSFASEMFQRQMSGVETARLRVDGVLRPLTDYIAGPAANPDSYAGMQEMPLSVAAAAGLLANDSVGTGTLRVTAATVTTSRGGSVTLLADGGFTYAPAIGVTGTDSFTYVTTDAFGRSATGTASVALAAGGPTASQPPNNWLNGGSLTPGTVVQGTDANDDIPSPGNATLQGGKGDDWYRIWDLRDRVVERPGEGIDTLTSFVKAHLLPDNVENLVVGAAGASGTGNALANYVTGSAGSQLLDGGAGRDMLTGGAGADRFLMQGGSGADVVTDFECGLDQLVIGGAFGQFTSFAAVQAALSQQGSDTVLRLSATDSVTFRGRAVGDFSAVDFVLPQAPLAAGLRPTFADEFTDFAGSPTGLAGDGTAVWQTTLMHGTRTLAANKETQYYADPSVGVNPFSVVPEGGGALAIAARPAAGLPDGLTYTSGLIMSATAAVQTYGLFEMRAQLPAGAGFWPAFWLLRADGVGPAEIDVVENLGDTPGLAYTTVHTAQTGSRVVTQGGYWGADLSDGHHSFAVSWRPEGLVWYLDGTAIFATATPADMHSPMYMLANLAVGGIGSWPGPTDGTAGATLLIDSIKAWQFADLAGPWRPPAIAANLTFGSWGTDTILGTAGDDRIEARTGNDLITGGAGADVFAFNAGDGANTITDFQPGIDKILVYGLNPVGVASGAGGVVVTLSQWNTVTLSGVVSLAAGDIVYADAQIAGTSAADLIDRGASTRAQYVSASTGADTVIGGSGDDLILGGQGADVLTGGAGADTFGFEAFAGRDRITDFVSGIDRILFRGVAPETAWVNPSRDTAGVAGLEVNYAVGQSIFLPGLTRLAAGDIVFSA